MKQKLRLWLLRKLGGVPTEEYLSGGREASRREHEVLKDVDVLEAQVDYYAGIWDRISAVKGHAYMRALRIDTGYWTPEKPLVVTNLGLPPGARQPKPPVVSRIAGLEMTGVVEQKLTHA